MLLVNTNRMKPPIAPVGLEYVASASAEAGRPADILDLCMVEDPGRSLREYFSRCSPRLVGLSMRNVDDCFWPSGRSFLGDLRDLVGKLRTLSDAKIVLGGVGFSIFARRIVEYVGADFGIRGDGERALPALADALDGRGRLADVPGLVYRPARDAALVANPPAWGEPLRVPARRDLLDNRAYFRLGGQIGLETKRGCPRSCAYCADPLAKGPRSRPRPPAEVADEAENLLAQGIDVLHLCDSEFNLPREHALAVCRELIARRLGEGLRWYVYLAVTPFDAELADAMARAGCAGINFTGDAAAGEMLAAYAQPHRRGDLERAVRLCREHRIAVMVDLLLGGPGETEATLRESIDVLKEIGPDCCGAALGLRVYPDTEIARRIAAMGPAETNPGIRRRYDGPVDLLQPTFYIAPELGEQPARLVRDLIAGDERFFPPSDEDLAAGDHNYNDNSTLVAAIEAGARGAYWHILKSDPRCRGVS
ncbi:MAG: (Dimethylallyl)adenosine tRNA methylthiotransferase MiaB [Planctomycetes bacterium ADurb.Bin126]|nr:MAG: (Dimethylallyl)adenosine tRNA methylthiotransferase MiaB [Planctomycetes bacterium ADurb.Bin126]HOD81069.1 radical SAM protein [Phycisphaerae bacterium]HQL76204.1 radical SAM protein [Phycisphaerae bacterium]